MGKVDVEKTKGVAREIAMVADGFDNCIWDCIEGCYEIEKRAKELVGYNGKTVAGSYVEESVPTDDGSSYTIAKWKEWQISGTNSVIDSCNSLEDNFVEATKKINEELYKELQNVEVIADIIDGYIKNIQESLSGSEINGDILANQFKFLNGEANGLSKIAYSESDALNGKFISSDKILTQYWDSYVLKFISNGDGTYSVMKGDTVMGFVTAFTAATYLKQLSSVVNKDSSGIEDSIESISDSSIVDERQEGDHGVREYANGNIYEYDAQGNGILTDKDGRILKVEGNWPSSDKFGEYTLSETNGEIYKNYNNGLRASLDNQIVDSRIEGEHVVYEYANGDTYESDSAGNGILTDNSGNILEVKGEWSGGSDSIGEYKFVREGDVIYKKYASGEEVDVLSIRTEGENTVYVYSSGNEYERDSVGNGIYKGVDGKILRVDGEWTSSNNDGEYTLSHDKNNSSFVYEYKDGKVVEVWEKSGLTKEITYSDGTRVDYNYEDDKISTYYSDGKMEVQSLDGNEKAVRYPDGTVEGNTDLLKRGMPGYVENISSGPEVGTNTSNEQSEVVVSESVDTTQTVSQVDENVRFSVPIPGEIAAAANINKNDTHYGKWSDSFDMGYGQGQGAMQDAWRELGMPDDRKIACVNGRYFVAVAEAPDGYIAEGYTEHTATLFGNIGDKINVHLNTGEVIECYIADAKSVDDLRPDGFGTPMNNGNGTEGTNIIEWESTGVVDDTGWNTAKGKGYAPEGEERVKILHIDNLGPGFDFNTKQFL